MNKQNIFILISVFGLLLLSGRHSFAQDKKRFTNIHGQIIINEDGSGFRSYYSFKGFTEEEASNFSIIYSELESIGKITVRYENAKGKLVKLNSNLIRNNAVISGSFYTGVKKYNFQLPQTKHFEYSYEALSNDLMLFSDLSFSSEENIDTVSYEVIVPLGYTLIYKPFEIDSTINLKIDSLIGDKAIAYYFTSINRNKNLKLYRNGGPYIHNEKTIPLLKLIVVPDKYKYQPEVVFNQWYYTLIKTLPPIDTFTLKEVREYIGSTSGDSTINKIFRFVQSKIKYIDVENGMQGFRPHDANITCLNKQGDCKDMAFLLYRILTYYGFNAHLAISATLDHYCDMDFPSLLCGNHAICVVKSDQKWIYLDATEKECEFGFPSLQIQGKHIFIISDSAGEYNYVSPLSASMNKSFFFLKLLVDDKKIKGTYNYEFRHVSAVIFKYLTFELKKSDFESYLKTILSNLTPSVTYIDINTTSTDSSFTINGNICLKDQSITNYSNKNYLSLGFIPYLDLLPKAMKHKEKMITYSTLNKITEITISFQDSINLLNPREEEFTEGDFKFKFEVKKVGLKEINIKSEVVYDDVVIKNNAVDHYNKLMGEINNQLNKGIIYE